jgi:hypothetical protein
METGCSFSTPSKLDDITFTFGEDTGYCFGSRPAPECVRKAFGSDDRFVTMGYTFQPHSMFSRETDSVYHYVYVRYEDFSEFIRTIELPLQEYIARVRMDPVVIQEKKDSFASSLERLFEFTSHEVYGQTDRHAVYSPSRLRPEAAAVDSPLEVVDNLG